jgi:hypothetical protein
MAPSGFCRKGQTPARESKYRAKSQGRDTAQMSSAVRMASAVQTSSAVRMSSGARMVSTERVISGGGGPLPRRGRVSEFGEVEARGLLPFAAAQKLEKAP